MNKFNLFFILISSIIFSLMTRVVEGFFGCSFDFNIKSQKGKAQKKLLCNNSTIGTTKLRQQDFQTNLGKLVALATKTQTLVFKNEKDIKMNKKNNKALGVVTDPDGEEDTSDACKKYPEAC